MTSRQKKRQIKRLSQVEDIMGLFSKKNNSEDTAENAAENADELSGNANAVENTCPIVATKETLVNDLIDYDIEIARFFFDIGMYCVGCPASYGESVEDACAVHGVDADELIEKINEYITSKNTEEQ